MVTHLKTRWASAPGETIGAVLAERKMGAGALAGALDVTVRDVEQLLQGRLAITVTIASRLADVLGASTQFWLAREAQYIDSLDRVRSDKWAQELPVEQMAKFGWIDEPSDWLERIETCLNFFDVAHVDEWADRHRAKINAAHFRASATYPLHVGETAAWFRAAEHVVARRGAIRRFDPETFRNVLVEVRALMRKHDPHQFLPELQQLCATAGVHLVVLPAPKGCPASGAARIYAGRPLIQLSARHLTDDHFWFSFFHEAGHVAMHELDESGYIDVLDADDSAEFEDVANRFAEANLVAPASLPRQVRSYRDILRIASAEGIPPGVLLGQLQHRGVVGHDRFNFLKRRYRWNGAILEMERRG